MAEQQLPDLDWSQATPEQYARLRALMQGKLDWCDGCWEEVPPADLVTVGIADDGGPRRFCSKCRSEDRDWALTPEEACLQCGTLRKRPGQRSCSEECEAWLVELEKGGHSVGIS